MTIRLFNTLTRTKEEFVPLEPGVVKMYHCGPTVYDFATIGNHELYTDTELTETVLSPAPQRAGGLHRTGKVEPRGELLNAGR